MIKNIRLLRSLMSSDIFSYIGDKVIKGEIKELGSNLPARVRLFEKSTGRMISDIKSNEHGEYAFHNLAAIKFMIISHHPTNQYNAVIQDNVVPK